MDVKYDPILGKLRERDTGGGGSGGTTDYNAGTGINSVALEGGTIAVANIPQSAVTGLTDALAGKQPTISSGATMEINITGSAGALSAGVVVESATNATTAVTAGTASVYGGTVGYAVNAGTAGALSAGVVVASATNATTAVTAGTASVYGGTVGYATSAGTAGTANAIANDVLTGGFRMEIVSGSTVSQQKWFPITTVTGASVTMQPGEAYVINATTGSKTINTTAIPANQYGLESHLEIFVSNAGYVVTGSNVVLAQALEPDSVNNCTVRFHDGYAIISVEDHIAGYIVVSASGTASGSLYYGLATASNEYISFNDTLAGVPVDLGGAVTNGEKNVVGNGYTDTILTGGIRCTSKTTFANLGMNGVVLSSGTLTLGDAYIPNGATVAVSGGSLSIEKVTGDGAGVINLGGTTVVISSGATAIAVGCTITGGSAANGGAFNIPLNAKVVLSGVTASRNNGTNGGFLYIYNGTMDIISSVIAGNSATTGGAFNGAGTLNVSASVISGNTATRGADFYPNGATVNLLGGNTIGKMQLDYKATVTFAGENSIDLIDARVSGSYDRGGAVTISSGAIIDLTSSIAPGGIITVLTGGCTVNGVAVAGGTYTSIDSTGTPT